MTTQKNTTKIQFIGGMFLACAALFAGMTLLFAVHADGVKPTILAAEKMSSTTVRITMSEPVYADNIDATVSAFSLGSSSCYNNGGQSVNSATGVSGLASDSSSASDYFTLTFSSTLCIDDILYYSNKYNTAATIKGIGGGQMPVYGNNPGYEGSKKIMVRARITDTVPTATIEGAPSGTSDVLVLNVTVGGTDVTHYKHKVVESGSCGTGGYGSDETAIATKIKDSLSSYRDGTLTLCVLGKNPDNHLVRQWQTSPTKVTWTKKSPEPTVSFNPVNGGILTKGDQSIFITFSDAIYTDNSGTGFNPTTLSEIIALKHTNSSGNIIPFSVVRAANSGVNDYMIEIDPTDDLADGRVYVAISNAWYYDQTNSSNPKLQGTSKSATFTVSIGTPEPPAVSINSSEANKIMPTVTVTVDPEQVNGKVWLYRNSCNGTLLSAAAGVPVTGTTVSVKTKRLVYGTTYNIYAKHRSTHNKSSCSSQNSDSSKQFAEHTPKDVSGPTILSATVSGKTVTFELSEKAYAPKGLIWHNLTSHPTLLDPSIEPLTDADNGFTTDIPSRKSAAKNSFTVTFVNTPLIGADFEYHKDEQEGDHNILDVTGNKMESQWDLRFAAGSVTNPTNPTNPTLPVATVSGVPSGASDVVTLDVTVGGTDVTHYKHKVVQGSSCGVGGYGNETAVGTKITDNLSSYRDGTLTLCVLGKDSAGNWQTSATSASWTKDVLQAPTLALETGESLTPTFTVTVDTSYQSGSVELFSDDACSTSNSISNSISFSGATVDVQTTSLTSGQSYTVYAKHTTGSKSACSASGVDYQYSDQPQTPTPPPTLQQPTIALQSPSSSPGSVSTPTFRVTVDGNYTSGSVQLFSNSSCSTSMSGAETVSSGNTTVDVTVTTAFTHGQLRTVYAKHTASSQNACSSTGVSYQYNAVLTAPTIALQSPSSSPGTDNTPTFRVTVDSNYTSGSVELFSNSACSTSMSDSVNVSSGNTTVDVTVTTAFTHGQSRTVYAKHTTGSKSACSTSGVDYQYNAALVAPTIVLTSGNRDSDTDLYGDG